jgi:hypothetical protein
MLAGLEADPAARIFHNLFDVLIAIQPGDSQRSVGSVLWAAPLKGRAA